ncbi:hypothetical protein EVAR_22974_1 [Eumeta japonica]|uniref:Uncharacterized protein n=1 Tax=Eumeta variegata TaxID=151549 RepID=A0A4C1UPX1_EUMVA|nr:hypothetical protein EVAR_22974_1 [Eumeta japonica]
MPNSSIASPNKYRGAYNRIPLNEGSTPYKTNALRETVQQHIENTALKVDPLRHSSNNRVGWSAQRKAGFDRSPKENGRARKRVPFSSAIHYGIELLQGRPLFITYKYFTTAESECDQPC